MESNLNELPSPQAGSANHRNSAPDSFRWRIIPAAISWFAAAMLLFGLLVWLFQAGIAIANDDTFDGFWVLAPSMTLVLLASAMMNVFAGKRWIRNCFFSAAMMNAGSALLIWAVATFLESYIRST